MGTQSTTAIEVPPTLVEALEAGHDHAEIQRWGVESLVLAAVGEGIITTGHAAQLLDLGYFETLSLIKKRGVPNPTSADDLARDQEDLRFIFPESFKN